MSQKKEVIQLLGLGETETVEFKERPNESFYKTISAFANSKGGTVILGISDNAQIIGVKQSSKFLEDLTNRIINKLLIYPDISTLNIGDKRVLIINVARSSYPVSYEGRYYERVGNTTREMSAKKLQVFMQSANPWDSLIGDFSLEEIDMDTVKRFIQLAVESKRLIDISAKQPVKILLQKLGMYVDGKLTNGAILLFGKNPQKYFINLCTRIGRFKDETTIIDDKWAKGNLFQQFEETINIIRQHISVRYEITDFQRQDIWDYPIPAIREAVLNALVHRDYFNIANFTLIKVYNDHIWFHNPGGLPEGITVEQLKKPHSSVFRNPIIAKVFYLAGLIEQYGSGTVRMVEWLKEAGLPEPEYKEEMGGFSVYFYKDIYTEENLRKMGLNERQIKAVMYAKERGTITNRELREIVNVTDRTVTRDLNNLCARGLLKKIGETGRGTAYTLTRQKPDKDAINPTKTRQSAERRSKDKALKKAYDPRNEPKKKRMSQK